MPDHKEAELQAGLLIRSARVSDADEISTLANALAGALGEAGKAMTPAIVRQHFIEEDNGLEVLVAEGDDKLLAYALHSIAFETAYAQKGRYLSDIYVRPEARARGIARALMAHVAGLTAAEGGSFLWWVAKPGTTVAKEAYASLSDVTLPGVTAYAITGKDFIRLATGDPS